MKKVLILALAGMLFLLLSGPAAAFELGVRGAYWFPLINSDLRADSGGTEGYTFDLRKDLDSGQNFFPWVEAWVGIGPHIVMVGYFSGNYGGDQTLEAGAIFDGLDFEDINTDFSMTFTVVEITYGYKVFDVDTFLAGLDLTLLGSVKFVSFSTSLSGGGMSESRSISSIMPSLGGQVHVSILLNILEARVMALVQPLGKSTVTDIILELTVTPFPFLDIGIGWRSVFLKIEKGDFMINHKLNGPFASVTVSF